MEDKTIALAVLGVVLLTTIVGFVSMAGGSTAASMIGQRTCLCELTPIDPATNEPMGAPQPHMIRVDTADQHTDQMCTIRCQSLYPSGRDDLFVQGTAT